MPKSAASLGQQHPGTITTLKPKGVKRWFTSWSLERAAAEKAAWQKLCPFNKGSGFSMVTGGQMSENRSPASFLASLLTFCKCLPVGSQQVNVINISLPGCQIRREMCGKGLEGRADGSHAAFGTLAEEPSLCVSSFSACGVLPESSHPPTQGGLILCSVRHT